ncbi:isovaleryl-CoA dehydrogenase [Verminephrobacter eiseniae]|uniref:isovaleryl-CoA dehydrogenase n=1 Tax=Verminephrobacter eiseniae TaxID=364317 RepID=UPI0010D2862D|nr:isovaleryl-CoA dehydrogenase [Verminephrobacter eiseniae]KAB7610540.1 isovaleryl-CoA dehydrogenase [Verminephrobacter sp. Larva24]MCW5230608.1 isovaleryl-CoA dehydrogenase [Verminephrobacter eiseniae]MCW5292341.1 isovaleryl-CoA dehydrogenase [Verminephrobacter eiseniae]MCW8183351.1 isovaleryl-CoA dehydrogenase [Verminephrobacter eiseniae]MCW8223081.1 isovaleryl-CoA dehydrogenase [Verminephrobacter eiseniae]
MNPCPASTHRVFNQSAPWVDVNLFTTNLPLQDAVRLHCADLPLTWLSALGAEMGSAQMQEHARLANTHKPQLHTHDRCGQRSDMVEFHPSYHALIGAALRHGLHATAWTRTGAAATHAHTERAAGFMLFTETEPSVLCPVSMSYAVIPALRGNAALWADWHTGLAGTRYDPRLVPYTQKSALTMGMGMTEKQGGSDVRANTTQALADGADAWGPRYRLTGHKWFFSAPMCDAFLVLAQAPGGLSCFFLPRVLPAGEDGAGRINTLRIQRLKDKLGNHANASAEVEFIDAVAWRVGEEGRGVAQILEMGIMTRLDCALGTSGLMRQALALALNHARQRMAFGKKLIDQPLMRNVLADLALESEAATALSIRLASAFDRQERDPHEAIMARLLTPVAKFWVCKRGSVFAQEAMECLGGNGYVEEGGAGTMARIYREMPLNSIWEGAGNIMALDLLRALRRADSAAALADELAPARGAHPALDRMASALPLRIEAMGSEAQARRLAQDMALAVQAALLYRSAPASVFGAFCASRLGGDWGYGFGTLGAGIDFEGLLARALPV